MDAGRKDDDAEREPLWLRVRHALGRIRRRFSTDRFDLFVRPVQSEDRGFAPPSGYRFAWATREDVSRCDEYHTELDERERLEGVARLGFGHRAVIAFAGDTAVFTMWVNPRNVNVPGALKRRLAPHQAFIYKAYTSPEHRGKSLYKAGMRFVLADMAAEGKTELVGYAHVKKRISRKGLTALDFESRGRFYQVELPGWCHTFVSRDLAAHFPEVTPRSDALSRAPELVSNP